MNIHKADNTTFGMSMIYKPSESLFKNYMFEKLNNNQYMRVEDMICSQNKNPIDIYISVINKNGSKKLKAEIGSKTFKENIFQSGYKVIKKSVKYANKLYKEKINNDRILKDFQQPKLDL